MFNEVLRKVSNNKNTFFNPRLFMFDQNPANIAALVKQYGEDTEKFVTYQWHFKHCAILKSREIAEEEDRMLFLDYTSKLCEAAITGHYVVILHKLEELSEKHPSLCTWLEFWDTRREHLFPAFKVKNSPKANLTEVGNALWKPPKPLFLVEAVNNECTVLLCQVADVKAFQRNASSSTGWGPSQAIQKVKEVRGQIARGKQYSEMYRNEEARELEVEEQRSGRSTFIEKKKKKKHK